MTSSRGCASNAFLETELLSWNVPAPAQTDSSEFVPVPELESKTLGARDLVRSEVWELVDYVQ